MSTDAATFLAVVAVGTLILAAVALLAHLVRTAPWAPSEDSEWDARDRAGDWIGEWEQARTPEATAERMAQRVGRQL